MIFLQDFIEFDYLKRSLLAILLASIASGIVGGYVVARRQSYLIGAVSHSLLGGIGLARYLQIAHGLSWFSTILGALFAAVLSAIAISTLTLKNRMRQDTVLSAIWTLGVAIGVSFIAITPGYSEDLTSYLFGSILLVSKADIAVMAVMTIAIVVTVLLFRNRFLTLCFNEETLALRGVSAAWTSFVLHLLIALTVVLLAQVVGIVLVLVLLVIPAATTAQFAKRISQVMLWGAIFCLLTCTGGLVASYEADWPVGATIVELAVAAYLVCAAIVAIRDKTRKTHENAEC
ncbi:MAG: metal ABC transporter permease [Victivallales bacterium]|nr:metal ABC transporter permease [Victivallales bacterium]